MSQQHELKVRDVYFDAIERGEMTFEVRRDDRGFQKGDTVCLIRINERGFYDNFAAPLVCRITYILTGGQFGIEPGYVVLAITKAEGRQP